MSLGEGTQALKEPLNPSEEITHGSSTADTSANEETASLDKESRQLAEAAELGDRNAYLQAALRNPEDPRAVDWVRAFYGDGVPTGQADRYELPAAALCLARLLNQAGDPEAGEWYRTAALWPRWGDPHGAGTSWVAAAAEYALWAHEQGNMDLCSAWAFRVLEDTADEGPSDRSYMAQERKIYRNTWQLAREKEVARAQIMRHLLTEHDLPEWQRMEILLLLTSGRWFGQADAEDVQAALGGHAVQPVMLDALLPPAVTQPVESLDVPMNVRHAWAAVHWLLADAVPAPFRFVGLEEEAEEFRRLVPDDIKQASRYDWVSAAEQFDGWRQLYASGSVDDTAGTRGRAPAEAASFGRLSERWIRNLTHQAGLGERPCPFETAKSVEREDWVHSDSLDAHWRLLRGQPAWLGMYQATAEAGEADEWIAWWDEASRFVVLALQGALRRLSHDLGTDWLTEAGTDVLGRPLPEDVREQWQTLGDAYELAFTTFLNRAPALK